MLSQDIDEETLRKYAASVDANSEHPIAKAIAASSEKKLPVENFKSIPGKGAEGRVEGKEVKVVSPGFLREQNIDARPTSASSHCKPKARRSCLSSSTGS